MAEEVPDILPEGWHLTPAGASGTYSIQVGERAVGQATRMDGDSWDLVLHDENAAKGIGERCTALGCTPQPASDDGWEGVLVDEDATKGVRHSLSAVALAAAVTTTGCVHVQVVRGPGLEWTATASAGDRQSQAGAAAVQIEPEPVHARVRHMARQMGAEPTRLEVEALGRELQRSWGPHDPYKVLEPAAGRMRGTAAAQTQAGRSFLAGEQAFSDRDCAGARQHWNSVLLLLTVEAGHDRPLPGEREHESASLRTSEERPRPGAELEANPLDPDRLGFNHATARAMARRGPADLRPWQLRAAAKVGLALADLIERSGTKSTATAKREWNHSVDEASRAGVLSRPYVFQILGAYYLGEKVTPPPAGTHDRELFAFHAAIRALETVAPAGPNRISDAEAPAVVAALAE